MDKKDEVVVALESIINSLRGQMAIIDAVLVGSTEDEYTKGEKAGMNLAIHLAEILVQLRKGNLI